MIVTVIDRFGKKSEVKLDKLRKVLNEAAKGLDVNLLELESHLDTFEGKSVTTTSDIQISLIYSAISMATLQNTDYSILAARLIIHEKTRASFKNLGYNQYENLYTFIKHQIDTLCYDKNILEKYSEKEILKYQELIRPNRDNDYDYAGVSSITNRYLISYELPQTMYIVISLLIAQNVDPLERYEVVQEIYEKISLKQISLATPILANLRRVDGNLSSCFVTTVDDTLESIFHTVDNLSKISANGGGIGVNLSNIRATGSDLNGNIDRGHGVIPWIKIINDTMVAVDQNGLRAGACTVSLDMWHLDLLDFLGLQTENGDQRRKAYDIFPQLIIPDLFMERAELDLPWTLYEPYEIKQVYNVNISELWGQAFEDFYTLLESENRLTKTKVISAKDTLKEIMKIQIETGMPYIFFKDAVNRANPDKYSGYIPSGNLCQESFSNVKASKTIKKTVKDNIYTREIDLGETHICNLVSINMAKYTKYMLEPSFDSELYDIHRVSTLILDNLIDITKVPIPEASKHNSKYRVIGIGYMGLHDHLALKDLPYISKEALTYVDKLFELQSLFTHYASSQIAKNKGKFPAYDSSEYNKKLIFQKEISDYKSSDYYSMWKDVFYSIEKYGMRNSSLSAIAPNTSSSRNMGCTAGIIPIFSKFYIDKNSLGSVPIYPPFIKDKFWGYIENKNINQKKVVMMVATIQKWITQGISMELLYNLNGSIEAKDIYDTIMLAWKENVKSIYYTRTIQKDSQIGINKADCVSCAN